jgi:hypothetical protein
MPSSLEHHERGFLVLTVEETARDVMVPLRSPAWSMGERYSVVMDMEMHSREVTVPPESCSSEWSSSGGTVIRLAGAYEPETRHTHTHTHGFVGSTASV